MGGGAGMNGEVVVSMCNYRDGLLVVTNYGMLFSLTPGTFERDMQVSMLQRIPLGYQETDWDRIVRNLEEELERERASNEAFLKEVCEFASMPWYKFLFTWPWKKKA